MSSRALIESLVRAVVCRNSCKLHSCIPSRHYWHPRTKVFERRHQIQLVGKGKYPLLKKKVFIYKMGPEPDNYSRKMPCILTKEVDGIGMEGQLVEVEKSRFRNNLYPLGQAVYASPENIKKYEEIRKTSRDFGVEYETKVRLQKLAQQHVNVYMTIERDWILDENHLRIALRQSGYILDNENIILDGEPRTNHGPFTFWVQIQKIVCIQISGTVHPYGGTYEAGETDTSTDTETKPSIMYYEDLFASRETNTAEQTLGSDKQTVEDVDSEQKT